MMENESTYFVCTQNEEPAYQQQRGSDTMRTG